MKRLYAVLTIATGLALAGCESDNSSDTRWNPQVKENINYSSVQPIDKRTMMLSAEDRRFLANAMAGGMYEMLEGQFILTASTDADVKNIAQHLVDDHAKSNLNIKTLGEQKGILFDAGLTTDQMEKISTLKHLSGLELDKEYLRQQQAAHQTAIQIFQLAASTADDSAVRSLASESLPTLRQHLDMINTQATAKGLATATELQPLDTTAGGGNGK